MPYDIYFWRQMLVLLADCLQSTGTGFMMSFPAILNPSILSPNATDIRATPDEASWIAASHGFAGVLGFCFIPAVMQNFGRKTVHMVLDIILSTGFVVFYFAPSVPILILGRVVQGVSLSAVYITCVMLSEYCHPNQRGYFISAKKCSTAVGALMCHALILFWTWRQIVAFAAMFGFTAVIVVSFRPESPSYLAMKGRFEECRKAHVWLNGDSPQSNKKLEELIVAQTERRNKVKDNRTIRKLLRKMLKKDFIKPFIIVSVLTMIVDSCGRYYTLAYIVQIIIEITGDKSSAIFCSIGTDLLTILALTSSGFVANYFGRRTILFSFGFFTVLLMFTTSLIIYLQTNGYVDISLWWTPSIILIHTFVVNVGIIPICFTLTGEVFPLEHKGMGLFTTGLVFTILYAIVMKCTPIMMADTGVEGTYSIYAFCIIICLTILYYVLPETKDKTLQQIENEIKGIERTDPLLSSNNAA